MCVYTHIFTPQVLEIEDKNLMFINYYVVAIGLKPSLRNSNQNGIFKVNQSTKQI